MGGSGGEGVGQVAETESTLALAENVYVNLPRPAKQGFSNKDLKVWLDGARPPLKSTINFLN